MKKLLLFLFITILPIVSINAQDENVEFSTRTPRSTIVSFQSYLSKNNYNPEKASYTLRGYLSREEKVALTLKLNILLKRYGRLKISKIPDDKNFENKDGDNIYVLFPKYPELYLEKSFGKWLFSKESVSAIDGLYKKALQVHYKRKSADILATTKNDSLSGKFSLSTPYHTITSHLFFIQDSTFRPNYLEKLIKDGKLSKEKRVEKVTKIYQYYLGATQKWIGLDEIPSEKNYIDTVSGQHIFVINTNVPELFLEKKGNDWVYSATTVELIDELHESVYPIGAERVFTFGNFFKELIGDKHAKTMFFGMQLYQFAMITFFLIVFIFSFFIVRVLVKFIIDKIISDSEVAKFLYKGVFALFLVAFISWILIFIPALGFHGDVSIVLKRLFGALLIFAITNLVLNIIEIWYKAVTRNEPKDTMTARKGAYTFLMAILKIIVTVVGSVFIVDRLGFDLNGLLAGISIGGFAFALGAQETIKNFFGSIMIFVDKPFQVGDWVEISGDEGVVEEVGLRSSRIRTFYNSLVIIPNSKVANITIDNYQKRNYRRYKAYYKLPLDTDVDKIEEFVLELENLIKSNENTRKDFFQVRVNEIGTYSIDILFYVFFRVPDWSTELESRHHLILSVLKVAKKLDIKFAVPPVVIT